MEITQEKICLCALNRIFGFEPRIASALISDIGSAAKVFALGTEAIDEILGPYSKFRGMVCKDATDRAEAELSAMERSDITFIGYTEEGYPTRLKECEDPPIGLYIKSSSPVKEIFPDRKTVSVVGTRDLSFYGREWCREIVSRIADTGAGTPIVSGLALGTDICAHRTATEKGLPTIAVMATGIDSVYPYRHLAFAERMSGIPGCALVTDYPPGTPPLAVHFLRRNRIIAGLSEATILIESRIKGGGMMTSRLAFSYGREVYALPGRIDDIRSQGCNSLIKDKIAEPIVAIDSLMTSLGLHRTGKRQARDDIGSAVNLYEGKIPEDRLQQMTEILMAIKRERGISLDELSVLTGMEYSRIAYLTGRLEADGIIAIDLTQRCTINNR